MAISAPKGLNRSSLTFGGELASKAVIVGCGTTGGIAAKLLADAGVSVRVIDRDFVDQKNLQRQRLFTENDIGKAKASVAAERLGVDGVADEITSDTITRLVGTPSVVLDCTDNMAARFLLNDYCLKNRVPWIYSGAVEKRGVVFSVSANGRPCLRCLIPKEPGQLESCDLVGVNLETAKLVATLQVERALSILSGKQPSGEMMDIHEARASKTNVPSRKNCEACNGVYAYLGKKPSATHLCGRDAYLIRLDQKPDLEKIAGQTMFKKEMFDGVLHLHPDDKRITLFGNGRAIVEAASESEARSRLARFVGV